MKKLQLFILMFLSLSFASQAQTTVVIDPNTRHQEMEGWGTSLCWWASEVGKWTSESEINRMIDFITSPDGMNMNVFRYNIGGGDNPNHISTPGNPGHMAGAGGKGARAEMEGFWPSESGDFDWTKDRGQIKILKKLNAKRSDVIFEAFSNSPPYWMTRSNCTSGVDAGTSSNVITGGAAVLNAFNVPSNLKPEYYDKFCYYLVEVCKHIKNEHGIEFRTLEPFNEPSLTTYSGIPNVTAWHTNPHFGGASQEGCHFIPAAQKEIIPKLYAELQNSGLNTLISASDETNISLSVTAVREYEKTAGFMDMIGQINTHSYEGSDTDRRNLLALANTHGKRIWQSESGPLNIPGEGLPSHLGVAQILFNDIKIMKPSAWIDWQFMDSSREWSLVTGNLYNGNHFDISKNAYVRMQVTRFIKQGYTIIENNNSNVLTAMSPDRTELVIVVLNTSTAANPLVLDLSAFHNPLSVTAYRTNSLSDCSRIAPSQVRIVDKAITYNTPGQSITTFVIPLGINYEASAIFDGIDFEDEDEKGMVGLNAEVVNNPQTQSLNRSEKALYVEGDIKYTFGSYYAPSQEYRYLHVMTYTPDEGGQAQTAAGNSEFALQPTNEWTDQVFDLNDCVGLEELNLLLPSGITSFYVDNIIINNDPNPLQSTEESPYFSFEDAAGTPDYRMLPDGETGTPEIVEISELLGINKEGKALKYTLPAGADHTLNILLSTPLRITEQTQYLHLMVYPFAGGITMEVGGVTSSPTFYPNTWQEVVVDISSLKTNVIWEINVNYSGLAGADAAILIDNIHFSDVSEVLSVTSELPDDSPYMIYNRKSQLALSPDSEGNGIIQTIADETETGMMWYFQPNGESYSLVNAKEKKVMAYNDQAAAQNILYVAKEDAPGLLFALNPSQNGYFVIKPQSGSDGLAMGTADGSVDDLSAIVIDTYLSGNNSQEFALFKMPKIDDVGINGFESKAINYSNAIKGELTVNLSGNSSIEIYTLQGVLVTQKQVSDDKVTFSLPTGVYILKIQNENNSVRSKVLVK